MSYTYLDDVADDTPVVARTRNLYGSVFKRGIDIAIVICTAPFVVPVLAMVWLLIMFDGGRGIYGQPRIGTNGRTFRCWKIRTMVNDADTALERLTEQDAEIAAEWAANQKLENDPRITWWGQILRKTSIDELPQLWNVLTGDMSLIGPRPFTPDQKALYDACGAHPAYYAMRPGISGLWQVKCRNNAEFCQRYIYDNQYAAELSFWQDIKIAFGTIRVILKGTGK